MNIRMIKKYLSLVDKDLPVYFDFCHCVPTVIGSWRGVYAEPSIGWDATSYSGNGKPPTVDSLLKELNKATSGEVYDGWKGGEFTYNDDDTLHVDNPGDCSYTEITHIEVEGWAVVLHTIKRDSL